MVALKQWTVDELLAMDRAGLLNSEKRVELIDGNVYEMSIGEDHAAIVRRLGKALERTYGDVAQVSIQNPVRMGDLGLPQPVAALLKPKDDFYPGAHPRPADAYLLIEVSDSTLKYDRETKLPSYAHNGVVEVWIINVVAGYTEVYREPAGGEYLTKFVVHKGQGVAPLAFPELRILPS